MIILDFTPTEILGISVIIAMLAFVAILMAYSIGVGSVNVDLEVQRRVKYKQYVITGYQPRKEINHGNYPPPVIPVITGQLSRALKNRVNL